MDVEDLNIQFSDLPPVYWFLVNLEGRVSRQATIVFRDTALELVESIPNEINN